VSHGGSGNSRLNFSNYGRARVINNVNQGVAGAIVNITDKNGTLIVTNGVTDDQGYTPYYILQDYTRNTSDVYNSTFNNVSHYTPHNFTASANLFNSAYNQSTMNESGTIMITLLSECGYINNDTTIYNDVTSSGTCFTFNASDVTLDCQGNSITGDLTGYGIYTNYSTNVTIKDCIISNFTNAIYLNYTNNSAVINNTGFDIEETVLYVNIGENLNISENNFTSHTGWNDWAMYINYMLDSNLQENILTASGNGIRMVNSERNNLTGNNITKLTYDDNALVVTEGSSQSRYYNHSIDYSNTINNKPVYFYSQNNYDPLHVCPTNVTDISSGTLNLAFCSGVNVTNATVDGDRILLKEVTHSSFKNIVSNFTAEAISQFGTFNITYEDIIVNETWDGIEVTPDSSYKNISITSVDKAFRDGGNNVTIIDAWIDATVTYSMDSSNGKNITFINSTIVRGNIRTQNPGPANIDYINVNHNKSSEQITVDEFNLTNKYYTQIRVITSLGSGVSGASVNITDVDGTAIVTDATTDSSGYISTQVLTEYIQNYTQIYAINVTNLTPHNFSASASGFNSSFNETTINESKLVTITLPADACNPLANWTISSTVICQDQVINMPQDAWINITDTGSLTFDNVTLIMNLTGNGTANITSFGNFTILSGSDITSSDSMNRYVLISDTGSQFTMNDSSLSYAGWNAANRGVILRTAAIVHNNTFTDNYESLRLEVVGSSIRKNSFSHEWNIALGDSAGGNHTIEYNNFLNDSMILFWHGDYNWIAHNYFNDSSITMQSARNNTIINNTLFESAIYMDYDTNGNLIQNSVINSTGTWEILMTH